MSEILGALFKYLIGALGIAAVGGALYAAFASNKTSDAVSYQTQLVSGVQAAYAGQGTFTTLNNTAVISGKLAPPKMVVSGALINPWNGAVTVAPDATPGQFTVTHANVAQDGCQKFAVSQNNAVTVAVNGQALTTPFEAGDAITKCNGATNTVVFTYAR